MSALPSSSGGRSKSPVKQVSSAGKPALALVAAGAGAFLGRKQLQKRKEQQEVTPITSEPVITTTTTPSVPRASENASPGTTPHPVDTPAPDSL